MALAVSVHEFAGDHHGKQGSCTAAFHGRFACGYTLREITDDRSVGIAFGLIAEHLPVDDRGVERRQFRNVGNAPVPRPTVRSVRWNRLVVGGRSCVLCPRLLRLVPDVPGRENHLFFGERLVGHERCNHGAHHEPNHRKRSSTTHGDAGR